MSRPTPLNYKNVSSKDHEEELLSATDVDEESIILAEDPQDEKRWRSLKAMQQQQRDAEDGGDGRSPSRWRRIVSRWRRYRWLVDTFLILVNISLSLLLMRNVERELSVSTMQVGGDYTGAGPDFPTKVVKWEADPSFVPNNTAEFFSDEIRTKWNTMLPANAGWGEATEGDTFFTTTMTHQLHCLFMMGRIYAGLTNNMTEKMPHDSHVHFLHCIDYIRQGIMCSADVALEPHGPDDSDDLGPGDGSWKGHHVCKDYKHIIPYLEEQISEGIRTVLPIDD